VTPTQLYGRLLEPGDVPAEIGEAGKRSRSHRVGTATTASAAPQSFTSRPGSTVCRGRSTRPSEVFCPPKRRWSSASP
jgi:hypothetical protein